MLVDPRDGSLAFRSDEVDRRPAARSARSRDAGDPCGRGGGHHRGAPSSPGRGGRARGPSATDVTCACRPRAARRRRRHAPICDVERDRRVVSSALPPRQRVDARARAARADARDARPRRGRDAPAAIRPLNRLRVHLPLLLALSASSPFWQGRATGFASTRTTLFDAFPRTGVPRSFHGYSDSGPDRRRAAAVGRHRRSVAAVVGRPPAAAARHRRGPHHGCADDCRRRGRPRGARAVAGAVRTPAPGPLGERAAGHRTHRGKPLPRRARWHRRPVHRWRLAVSASRRSRSSSGSSSPATVTPSGSAASGNSPRCARSRHQAAPRVSSRTRATATCDRSPRASPTRTPRTCRSKRIIPTSRPGEQPEAPRSHAGSSRSSSAMPGSP